MTFCYIALHSDAVFAAAEAITTSTFKVRLTSRTIISIADFTKKVVFAVIAKEFFASAGKVDTKDIFRLKSTATHNFVR